MRDYGDVHTQAHTHKHTYANTHTALLLVCAHCAPIVSPKKGSRKASSHQAAADRDISMDEGTVLRANGDAEVHIQL